MATPDRVEPPMPRRATGRRWDDVFLSFGYALSSEDQRRKYRPAPYLMRAERELRDEADEECAEGALDRSGRRE